MILGIVTLLILLTYCIPMLETWSSENILLEQSTSGTSIVSLSVSGVTGGQTFRPTAKWRITQAEVFLNIENSETSPFTFYGGITTKPSDSVTDWIWYDVIEAQPGSYSGWFTLSPTQKNQYADVYKDDLVYLVIKISNINPSTQNIYISGTKSDLYTDGSTGTILGESWIPTIGDFAFKLYGKTRTEYDCQGTISITVETVDEEGSPLKDVDVLCQGSTISPVKNTGNSSETIFTGLQAGQLYVIRGTKDGYEPSDVEIQSCTTMTKKLVLTRKGLVTPGFEILFVFLPIIALIGINRYKRKK